LRKTIEIIDMLNIPIFIPD